MRRDEELYEELLRLPAKARAELAAKLIRSLDGHSGTSVEWEIKKYKTVRA